MSFTVTVLEAVDVNPSAIDNLTWQSGELYFEYGAGLVKAFGAVESIPEEEEEEPSEDPAGEPEPEEEEAMATLLPRCTIRPSALKASIARADGRIGGALIRIPRGTVKFQEDMALEGATLAFERGAVLEVDADRTIGAHLDFSKGGQISVADGKTVTLTGRIHVPTRHPAFDVSLGGHFSITQPLGFPTPDMFGAKADGVTDDIRPVRAAHAHVMAHGGTLTFLPGIYRLNPDADGPLPWTADGAIWKGTGKLSTTILNDSIDGVDLISFDGVTKSIQHGGLTDLKIESGATAGHIWSFASMGVSYMYFRDLWCHQKNPQKAIMYWDHTGNRGHFENRFQGGIYEHGTTNNPAEVPAFYFRANKNTFSIIAWEGPMRWQLRHSLAPFMRIEKWGGVAGAQFHNIVFRQVNIEQARRGCFYLAGCEGTLLDKVEFFDSDEIDGHLIEVDTAMDADEVPGAGRNSEFITLRDIQFQSGELLDNLVGKFGTSVSVTSLTQAAGLATCDTATDHGLAVGMRAFVAGANQADYNGRVTVVGVPSATRFTYAVDSGAASPATGTITAAHAAMDVKVTGTTTNFMRMENCKSPGSRQVEVDLGNRSALVTGHTNRVSLFRENKNTTTVIGSGTDETMVRTKTIKCAEIAERGSGDGIDLASEMRFASEVQANGGLAIGSGNDPLTGAAKYDVADVAWSSMADGDVQEQDLTVTGVVVGDRVTFTMVSTGSNPLGTKVYPLPCIVVAADKIRVAVLNKSGGSITPTTRTWRFTVLSHV